MALVMVTYMVLRVPSTKHMPENFTLGYGVSEQDIERQLTKDKNVLDFYRA